MWLVTGPAVSKRGKAKPAFLISSTLISTSIGLSIAVPQISPSPCAAWVSPRMQILLWKPQTWPKTRSCNKPQPRCWLRPMPPSRTFSACCKAKRNAKLRCKTIKKKTGPQHAGLFCFNPMRLLLSATALPLMWAHTCAQDQHQARQPLF